MRVAYFDCIGGIAGDMALGALLDAGADLAQLREGLRSMDLPPWELQVGRVSKSGIAANSVDVLVRGEAAGSAPLLRRPPSDAPLGGGSDAHVHSHEHVGHPGHDHTHTHEHSHTHSHEHAPSHADEEGHSGTRTFGDVAALIRSSSLPEPVKASAEAVYRRLAEAEAAVHGSTLESVHFHEVGAVDSIVDVVGAVYALHLLGVERVICSPLPNGHGFVRCAHGMMPVPPPATAELLKGCPLRAVDVQAELVTPTGAALASTLAESFGPMPSMTLLSVGYGAGRKDFPFPNLCRVVIGEVADRASEVTTVTLIEANIDDQSPQLYEGVFQSLFAAGALDVWLTPIQMKKNRPGQTLSVLAEPGHRETLTRILFEETTTLGVRYTDWSRTCLDREWIEVETEFGTVRVKVARQDGELRTASPEYEDCRTRAREAGVPVKRVHAAASAAAWQALHRR